MLTNESGKKISKSWYLSYYAFGRAIETYIRRRVPALMSVPTSLIFKTMSNRKAFSSRSFVLKLNPHQSFKKVPIETSQAHAVVGKEQDWPPFPDSSSALDWVALLESNLGESIQRTT